MSHKREFFTDFKPIPLGNWKVKGIGGTVLHATGYGNIPIKSTIDGQELDGVLEDVLYVPGLGANLFSIGSTTDAGVQVTFVDDSAVFKKNGRKIMTGKRVGKSLYLLQIVPSNASSSMTASTMPKAKNSLHLMHLRCAHLNTKAILRMSRLEAVEGMTLDKNLEESNCICEGCIFGKMKRTPFKTGRTRATKTSQILHCDVGFSPIKTPNGESCFLLIKDDFSEWTETYLMKKKSEAEQNLLNFIAFIENVSGNKVQIVRTDGGGEFGSNHLKQQFAGRGIVHQTSNSHTPQQNGVSERMNRTVIESTRSSLHMRSNKHTNIFKSSEKFKLELWGAFLQGAVYVLNRTLTCTSTKTPFERLYNRKPSIEDFRVPGCRAYYRVPTPLHGKMDAKGIPCWFVGYARETTKGWILWNPEARKFICSRDVTFDESLLISDVPELKTEKSDDLSCKLFDPLLVVTEVIGLVIRFFFSLYEESIRK